MALPRTASIATLGAFLLLAFASLVRADPGHYFVVRETADRLEIVSHRHVELGSPGRSSAGAHAPNRLEHSLSATVRDKHKGTAAFDTRGIASPWLRGEFHGHGKIEGHVVANPEKVYVVRVPRRSGSTLRIKTEPAPGARSLPPLEIDLDQYDTTAKAGEQKAGTRGVAYTAGNPDNRLDLLIVAEGYTDGQQPQFVADVQSLVDGFFQISPYAEFRHLFNVHWLFVPSNQAGADKPSCPETPGAEVVSVDTAFDATFCTNGVRRMVSVNTSKVLNAASAVPEWDRILVLVNDSEYGGSGGTVGTGTRHVQAVDIMRHEFGHTFSLLADEYDTASPNYPSCSDLGGSSPCEPNVTDQTNPSLVKWKGWVAAGTPMPTTGPLADELAAGLWQGARYQSSGMYRQCDNGLMRCLGRPFCDVDSEAFVKRLYEGGWGWPVGGIDFIEPGALPAESSVQVAQGSSVSFQAVVVGSPGAQALDAAWLVDGVPAQQARVATGTQLTFSYTASNTATHTIELRVTDTTSFLLQATTKSRQWTVTGIAAGVPGAPTITGVTSGNSQATLSFSPPASTGGSPISSYTATCNPGSVAASAAASPITVGGLANGVTYSCSVRATNASGPGPSSATVSVTPSATTTAGPGLVSVTSRRSYGPAGYIDTPIDMTQGIDGAITVDPHAIGDGFRIVFRFDVAISSPGTASVRDPSSAPIGTAMTGASGNEVIVTLTGVPDNRRATISLTGLDGGTATYSVSMGFLVGDVDGSRSVTTADVDQVRSRVGEATTASNAKLDLDANGAITASDVLAAKGRSGLSLP